ncbi:unnamed protein product [Anisakis simplex]|uniref:Secreted protein n=1 Tax=Anisakis simplex TaxID=6269 RepID=A0A0M3K718_ANISI|nr:unnamed protein product [Anisakis simplex]
MCRSIIVVLLISCLVLINAGVIRLDGDDDDDDSNPTSESDTTSRSKGGGSLRGKATPSPRPQANIRKPQPKHLSDITPSPSFDEIVLSTDAPPGFVCSTCLKFVKKLAR